MPPIIPGQGQAGMMSGAGGQAGIVKPPVQSVNPLQMLAKIDGKLDAILEHIGIDYKDGKADVSKDEYMKADDAEKDAIDEKQILGKT